MFIVIIIIVVIGIFSTVKYDAIDEPEKLSEGNEKCSSPKKKKKKTTDKM